MMLVDGGHAATGDEIVAHLRKHFGPTPVLEHVVLTHSDGDHASGLRTVLKEIPVRNLWLHIPWAHATETVHLFANKRWTVVGLEAAIKREYDIVAEIVNLAQAAGCTINAAFQGADIGPFRVCSPSREVYNYLLPQFDRTPDPDQAAIGGVHMWLGKETLAQKLFEAARGAVQSWTTETWEHERLQDGGITSASNESSVILYGAFDNGQRVLLTGDAGVNGLHWAAYYAESIGLPLQQFSFVQIPHHGSRRNVGPSVLTRLLGPPQRKDATPRFTAFVSAPEDDATHPRLIVLNAFKRRGGRVHATQGRGKVHYGGFSKRNGYGDAQELPFYDRVEEYT
ncbi:MBL fold metallo-hydrolase [Microvirga arabica]|nr:MBL fold metallo-hydrolase [Microvirga arabica]